MLTEGCGDLGGVAGGGDDGVAGVEGGLGQVDAHAAGGAGDEPDRGDVTHTENAFREVDISMKAPGQPLRESLSMGLMTGTP